MRRGGAWPDQESTQMAHRLTIASLAGASLLLCAPAADEALVYVKRPGSLHPQVWAARDGGGHRHRLGDGTTPVISGDGSRAAWLTFGTRDAVLTRPLAGGHVRRVVRARDIGDIALSADGTRLAVALRRHIAIYDTATRKVLRTVRGSARGLSFSPDSTALAYGLWRNEDAFGRGDIHVLELATGAGTALTSGGRSVNPLWGPREIVFDRVTPRGRDAPVFQLRAVRPDGTGRRRITHLRVPSLLDGLVPIDVSADGRRLVAEFEGQDTSVGFTVNPATGRTRSLSRNQETGFVAAAISRDGTTVLGSTGGADPLQAHDVVTKPYGGGRATILVRHAGFPDWSR